MAAHRAALAPWGASQGGASAPTPLPNSTRPYAGEEWFFVRVLPKKRSRRLALSEKQMAPNTKEVERLTFVCNQPAAVGPTLNPILHVTE